MTAAGTGALQALKAGFDLAFLDADRSASPGWWPDLRRVLRPGGRLVVDNALSHADELEPFAERLRADPAFTCALLPVGKGELLAVRDA